MSTPYLMYRKRYSSPAAGGGVHGMDVGTDPITMTEVGVITGERQVSTNIFMRVGGTISGIIGGEDNSGIISGYLNGILIAIGVHGKETGTGTVEDTPVTSVEDIPVEDTPVTSAEDIPVENTPVTSAEDIPVEDTPVTSVEDIPVEDTPVTSVEDIPVEDTPVTSAEDIPVEDTPVTSVEDIPVEDIQITLVEENQLNKVVLNQAGKAPVVPIIREMKDDKKDRIEGKAAKCQIAA
jgi:hypothetical protein